MVKRMKCDVCCGRGMTIPEHHGGMFVPIRCKHCNGTGRIEVPTTNADRFRAMSDDEQQKCVRRFWEIEDFADWLKQPAE